MSLDPEKSLVLDRLQVVRDTLDGDTTVVSQGHQDRLKSLVDQLGTPTRIIVAGLQASEHGKFAEFLVGTDLFTNGARVGTCPPIKVCYGRDAQTIAVNGQTRTPYAGCEVATASESGELSHVELELPQKILTQFNFLVYPSYSGTERQRHQLFQIIKAADLVVWCSNAVTPFDTLEAQLWKGIPDRLRDRRILALTGADRVTDSESTRESFEDKCDIAADYFDMMVSIAVDRARAAAPDGTIKDVDSFTASGGQNVLNEILVASSERQADLVEQARALLTEIEEIQEADAARKQEREAARSIEAEPAPAPVVAPILPAADLDLSALDEDDDDAGIDFDFSFEAPSLAEVKTTLTDGIKSCQASLDAVEEEGFGRLFAQMVELLGALRGFLRSGLQLTDEHQQVAIQLDEAEELVGLFSYDGDEKSAHDAADIVQQVCIDFWERLPSEESDSAMSDTAEPVSDDTNPDLEVTAA